VNIENEKEMRLGSKTNYKLEGVEELGNLRTVTRLLHQDPTSVFDGAPSAYMLLQQA